MKGPSVTLGLPPANETRAPMEGGCSPSSPSSTPAFCSSWLYFIMAATAFASGIVPGWAFSYPLGIISIMNRIVIAPFLFFKSGSGSFCELHGHFFGLYASVLACSARQLPDRAHLDAANAGGWHEGGDVNGVVQVPGVHQIKAGQLLVSFGKRA